MGTSCERTPANLILVVTLGWINIPFIGEYNAPSCFMLEKLWPQEPTGSHADFTYLPIKQLVVCHQLAYACFSKLLQYHWCFRKKALNTKIKVYLCNNLFLYLISPGKKNFGTKQFLCYMDYMCSPKGYGFQPLVVNMVLILTILVINKERFLHSSL